MNSKSMVPLVDIWNLMTALTQTRPHLLFLMGILVKALLQNRKEMVLCLVVFHRFLVTQLTPRLGLLLLMPRLGHILLLLLLFPNHFNAVKRAKAQHQSPTSTTSSVVVVEEEEEPRRLCSTWASRCSLLQMVTSSSIQVQT